MTDFETNKSGTYKHLTAAELEVKKLKAEVRGAFGAGFDLGSSNQIDQESAWEAYVDDR